MVLSPSLLDRLEQHLTEHLETQVTIDQENAVGGGSISDAYRLQTGAGDFFVKVNHADRFPSLFQAEADGLHRLRSTHTFRVPEVIAVGEDGDTTYLLLEHITQTSRPADFAERFGRQLAALHRHTQDGFGLDRPNYIGSLPQSNTPEPTWVPFFIHQRLAPLVQKALEAHKLEAATALRFERLYNRLPDLFPTEPPALLHGDLWHANLLVGPVGAPVLIDPAVYYGHREMDLAMMRLFGGFDPEVHTAYTEAWPLADGWEERVDLCNLYPLLVHLNLFGGGYLLQLEAVLRRFV